MSHCSLQKWTLRAGVCTLVPEVYLYFSVLAASRLSRSSLMEWKIKKNIWDQGTGYEVYRGINLNRAGLSGLDSISRVRLQGRLHFSSITNCCSGKEPALLLEDLEKTRVATGCQFSIRWKETHRNKLKRLQNLPFWPRYRVQRNCSIRLCYITTCHRM